MYRVQLVCILYFRKKCIDRSCVCLFNSVVKLSEHFFLRQSGNQICCHSQFTSPLNSNQLPDSFHYTKLESMNYTARGLWPSAKLDIIETGAITRKLFFMTNRKLMNAKFFYGSWRTQKTCIFSYKSFVHITDILTDPKYLCPNCISTKVKWLRPNWVLDKFMIFLLCNSIGIEIKANIILS